MPVTPGAYGGGSSGGDPSVFGSGRYSSSYNCWERPVEVEPDEPADNVYPAEPIETRAETVQVDNAAEVARDNMAENYRRRHEAAKTLGDLLIWVEKGNF
ncbi:hypothetical protein ACPC54_36900 [Kitasatospora sp. NPDC094028]